MTVNRRPLAARPFLGCARAIILTVTTVASTSSAPACLAALLDRGGGLIYDTELNITWLQDANHAKTTGFHASGQVTWFAAMSWAAGLEFYDPVRDRVWDDWRLPSAREHNGTEPCFGFACNSSEMGHLNLVDGIRDGVSGPFMNFTGTSYWSGTERARLPGHAWVYNFGTGPEGGKQDHTGPFEELLTAYAWAVRDGDVMNLPPLAQADEATVPRCQSADFNLVENDSDSDGDIDPDSITIVTPPAYGEVVVGESPGAVRYAHVGTQSATDSFSYTLRDRRGDESNIAQVTIRITDVETSDCDSSIEQSPSAPPITSDTGGGGAGLGLLLLVVVLSAARYREHARSYHEHGHMDNPNSLRSCSFCLQSMKNS